MTNFYETSQGVDFDSQTICQIYLSNESNYEYEGQRYKKNIKKRIVIYEKITNINDLRSLALKRTQVSTLAFLFEFL